MTLQTIPGPVYLGPRIIRDTSATAVTINTSSYYVAWIIQAPKTGTIDRIQFYATTVTADGDGLRARIETVSATTGDPSGSLVGGSSEVTIATVTANAWNRSGAGLAAAVTKGDMIAVMLKSPAAGSTFNGIVRAKYDTPLVQLTNSMLLPYYVQSTATTTHVVPGMMDFVVEYDDGTCPFVEHAWPLSAITSTTFSSASTPDERGNLFQVPITCRVAGIYTNAQPAAGTTACTFILYSDAGATLASVTLDGDQMRATGSAQPIFALFPAAVTLSANTNYRVAILPTAGSWTTVSATIDTSGSNTRIREAFVIGTAWQRTTRSDAGAWTDVPDSVEGIGLIVDQLDDGAGGASTGKPGGIQELSAGYV